MRLRHTSVPQACTTGQRRQGSVTRAGTSSRQHCIGVLPPRTGTEPNVPGRFCPSPNGRGLLLSLVRQAAARPDNSIGRAGIGASVTGRRASQARRVAASMVRERRYLVIPGEMSVTLSWVLEEARSTICAASTYSLTLVRWEIRRSRSNASSGPHRCWAITMPLACSITGMVPILARSRANAESRKISLRDPPRRTRSQVARARALVSADVCLRTRDSIRTASNRSRSSHGESRQPGSTLPTLPAVHGRRQGWRRPGNLLPGLRSPLILGSGSTATGAKPMRDDNYEPNRVLGIPRGTHHARQGEEPQRVMGMPADWFADWFGPADPRIQQSLAHPIRAFRRWKLRRRLGPFAPDEDEAD
jgi:hypothetical protein